MITSAKNMRPGELFVLESDGEIFQYVAPDKLEPVCGFSDFHLVMLRRVKHTPDGPRHVMRVAHLWFDAPVLHGDLAKQNFQAIADAVDDWIALSQTNGAQ
jgi:hypothetical protein